MDVLKSQLARIQQQLGQLSASQRMLAMALVVIMVMTLLWWSSFAARSEMEALLPQSLTVDELTAIRAHLENSGAKFEVVNDRVLVPSTQKMKLLGELSYAGALPENMKNAFEEMITKGNPFQSTSMQDRMYNVARQTYLAQVLGQWPPVRHAAVIIDGTNQPKSFKPTEPSATVSLTLKSGEKPSQRMAEAAAALVSGSVVNLSRHKVSVLINMQSFNVRDREDPDLSGGVAGEEWLGIQQKAEQYYKRKIDEYFAVWVEGVISTVSVDPNFKRTEQTVHAVDPKNVLQKEVTSEQVTEESNSTQNGAAEPGLASNAPLAIADAPAGAGDATSTTNDKSKTDFVVDYGKTSTHSTDPGGNARVTGASVLLPRSHFVRTYRKNKGMSDDQQPDETVLEAFIAQELVKLKPAVQRCLNGASPEIVHVESYTDLLPLASAGSPQVASAAPMMLLVAGHAKEIALGALAIVSLFMVSSMVKKGSASPIAAAYAGSVKNSALAPPDEVAGEVRESGPLLDGMELDEDSVKAQQMLNQVANLVEENPDAAATLVKRWLNRS
jgi:flagellar biosynthesis/type III secretory pathway M-ring protein FliF/YscJ